MYSSPSLTSPADRTANGDELGTPTRTDLLTPSSLRLTPSSLRLTLSSLTGMLRSPAEGC